MKRVVFRCDASTLMGSGHIFRCRTLARELARYEVQVIFLCRKLPGNLIELLRKEFTTFDLTCKSLPNVSQLKGRELYRAWLGCSQSNDANECIDVLINHNISSIDWFVVDHYGIDISWEEAVLNSEVFHQRPKLLVLDDLADRKHLSDLLLDQNYFPVNSKDRYIPLVPCNCRQFLGPHYALLGPEYSQLANLIPPRTDINRVLVYFGGVDPNNLTRQVLEVLSLRDYQHLAVDVVLGIQSENWESINLLANKRPNTYIHEPLPSLAGLMSRADLAIGAGGATTWERACLGLPSILFALSDNQVLLSRGFHDSGNCIFIDIIDGCIRDALIQGLTTWSTCLLPHPAGRHLTDGFGAKRIATALLGVNVPVKLRPVSAIDEYLLWRWANDSVVRSNSFNSDPIPMDTHHTWFSAGLISHNRLHYILTDQYDCPLGQIRFDRDFSSNQVDVDLSLDQSARGYGLGRQMVEISLPLIFNHWGGSITIIANVLLKNYASQRTFSKLGFKVDHSRSGENFTCWHYKFSPDY